MLGHSADWSHQCHWGHSATLHAFINVICLPQCQVNRCLPGLCLQCWATTVGVILFPPAFHLKGIPLVLVCYGSHSTSIWKIIFLFSSEAYCCQASSLRLCMMQKNSEFSNIYNAKLLILLFFVYAFLLYCSHPSSSL